MLHTMYFADEVRDFGEIEKGEVGQDPRGRARSWRSSSSTSSRHDEFKPEQYQDEYRQRVLDLVEHQGRGQGDHHRGGPEPQRAQVIDLMDALKQSLAKRAGAAAAQPADKGAAPTAKKPPAKAPRRVAAPDRKAQAGRK